VSRQDKAAEAWPMNIPIGTPTTLQQLSEDLDDCGAAIKGVLIVRAGKVSVLFLNTTSEEEQALTYSLSTLGRRAIQ
jgi:hypothetical protein